MYFNTEYAIKYFLQTFCLQLIAPLINFFLRLFVYMEKLRIFES